MTPDLQVDTAALRLAAGRIAEAAVESGAHHPALLPAVPDGALGCTPLARESALLVQRRTLQAFELADGLSQAAGDLAARVLAVADLFDRVEPQGRSAGE